MASTIQVDKIQDTGGNTILSSNSTGTFTYVSGTGMGKVLQVVANQLNASGYTLVQQSWIAIVDMDVTITPAATTSKVLVNFNCGGYNVLSSTAIHIRIKRDSTVVRECGRWAYDTNTDYSSLPISITYLDSPSTTSEVTYTIEMYVDAGSLHINRSGVTDGGVTIAQEIGA